MTNCYRRKLMKYTQVIENLNALKLEKIAESLSNYVDKINKEQVMELSSLRFLEEHKNILLICSPGTRKNPYSNCYRN